VLLSCDKFSIFTHFRCKDAAVFNFIIANLVDLRVKVDINEVHKHILDLFFNFVVICGSTIAFVLVQGHSKLIVLHLNPFIIALRMNKMLLLFFDILGVNFGMALMMNDWLHDVVELQVRLADVAFGTV
jgi:hypothetical protein